MMDAAATARAIDDVVSHVDGVVELYSAGPMIGRVWRQAVDQDAARTVLGTDAGVRTVDVSIGVSAGGAARMTAARVAQAVRAHLAEPDAVIEIRVSRIVAEPAPETSFPTSS